MHDAPARSLFARALFAFLALPGIVAFILPAAVVYAEWDRRTINVLGPVPWLAGVVLLMWCVRVFYTEGRGTLAPWDPPKHLVVSGPYQWSRNPMYVAVALMLLGWASTFSSTSLWLYAVGVIVAFHMRVVGSEEPFLARTHGQNWTHYTSGVRRWL